MGEELKDDEEAKEEEEPAPLAELTEEEAKLKVTNPNVPDVSSKSFSKFYAKFCLPAAEDGFGEIRYAWEPADKCAEILKKYILQNKLTQKCEEIKPSAWFKEQSAAWKTAVSEWRARSQEWK